MRSAETQLTIVIDAAKDVGKLDARWRIDYDPQVRRLLTEAEKWLSKAEAEMRAILSQPR